MSSDILKIDCQAAVIIEGMRMSICFGWEKQIK